jgi:quinohemoprotein ethanol dehydrogenase
VFASVNTRLIIYRADNGDQLMDITTGLSQMGPPMTFLLDGKQYVAIAGGPPQTGGGRGRGAAPAADAVPTPPQPSRLLVYALDGKATLPAPPAAPAPPAGR